MNFKLAIKITLSLTIIGFILYNTNLEEVSTQLSEANLWYIPIGIGIYLTSQCISSWRWKLLAHPIGFDLPVQRFYDYYMIGMYFNLFLPGAIGGDALRMYYLAKGENRPKRDAFLTILADRGMGLLVLLLLTGLTCLLPQSEAIPSTLRYGILLLCGFMIIGFISLHILPIKQLAEKHPKLPLLALIDSASIYWKDFPLLFKSMGFSLLVHSCMIATQWCCTLALDIHIELPYLISVYGVVTLASAIPLFFNGLGIREWGYTTLLNNSGITEHTAISFAFYVLIISTLTSLIGGLFFLKGEYKTPKTTPAIQAS